MEPRSLLCALVLEETVPYFNIIPIDPMHRAPLRLPILALICLFAVRRVKLRGAFALYAVLLAWGLASCLWSLTPDVSLGRWIADALLFLALASTVARTRAQSELWQGFLLGCSILVALNLAALPVYNGVVDPTDSTPAPWHLDWDGLARYSGLFGEPNSLGGLMFATLLAASLLYGEALLTERLRNRRVLWARLAALGAIALGALADSRTAFIALAAGGIAWCVHRRQRKWLVLLTLAAVLVALRGGAYVSRGLDTATGRTDLWQWELHELRLAPVTGYGYAVEGALFGDRLYPGDWEFGGEASEMHNGYMSIAVGLGIPALVLWLTIFMRVPWYLAVPFLVDALAESGFGSPRYPMGILTFLVWMVAEHMRLARKAANAREEQLDSLDIVLRRARQRLRTA